MILFHAKMAFAGQLTRVKEFVFVFSESIIRRRRNRRPFSWHAEKNCTFLRVHQDVIAWILFVAFSSVASSQQLLLNRLHCSSYVSDGSSPCIPIPFTSNFIACGTPPSASLMELGDF
jgi:hypothetical protein